MVCRCTGVAQLPNSAAQPGDPQPAGHPRAPVGHGGCGRVAQQGVTPIQIQRLPQGLCVLGGGGVL